MRVKPAFQLTALFLLTSSAWAATDVPVPTACTPAVNSGLAQLIAKGQRSVVDNVMVCGVTTGPSRTQSGGAHGPHEVLPLRVSFPDGSAPAVEVVVNDALDGKVTAGANASVFAFGQAFFDATGQYAAGIHDVHCATHSGADNGWVVVDGARTPTSCAHTGRRHRRTHRFRAMSY